MISLWNKSIFLTIQNSYFLPLLCSDEISKGKSLSRDAEKSPSAGRDSVFAEVKEKTRAMSSSRNEVLKIALSLLCSLQEGVLSLSLSNYGV